MKRKQDKHEKGKDPPNLKRFRASITAFNAKHASEDTVDPTPAESKDKPKMTRKQKRKEERKLKKAKRNAFCSHAPIPKSIQDLHPVPAKNEKKVLTPEEQKALNKRKKEKQKAKKREKEEESNKEKEWKKQAMAIENKREDKLIKQLEKSMKMNKRKKKKVPGESAPLPKAFTDDGLDYLLDAVDSNKLKAIYDEEGESDLDLGLDSGSDQDVSEEESDDFDLYEESPPDPSDSSKDEEAADFMQIIRAKDKGATKQVKFLEDPVEGSDGDKKEKKKKSKKKEKSVKFALEEGGNVDDDKLSVNKPGQKILTDSDVGAKVQKGQKDRSGKSVGLLIGEEGNSNSDSDENMREKSDTGASKLKKVKKGKKVVPESDSEEEMRLDSDDDEGSDEEELEEDSGEEFASGDEEYGSEYLDSEASDNEEERKPKLKEDIYGRLRDAEGNIYKESEVGGGGGGAYVPPAKRLALAQGSEKKKIELERLKKQLKGLLNRVSESNMQGICGQIGQLYLHHSRADMNESLTEILMTSCISPVLTPERLGLELAMLVAVLHSNVGIEVGAFFLQQLANKFDERFNLGGNYGDGKEADNILTMIGHLYNFKVIHCLLVFDILRKLTESFHEKDIELIMGLLKNVGFGLRKDDPAALKEVIVQIQTKANTADMEQFQDKSRVKFMLEVLLAIRNNNVRKIPNYDPSHLEHLKKLLRGYVKGSGSATDSELRISFHDLVNAENKGRWWVVGSAWTGRDTDRQETVSSQTSVAMPENISMEIMDLAKKQRMNTDVRRTIFCVLMTSEDFVDAFEKLLRLSLKHQQEREIIHVIMDCCLQEKVFNPYYAYLGQKFCEYDRRFQMTIQFHLWDKLKTLQGLSNHSMSNLAKFLVHLFATKALSISVLKVIEFGEMDKIMVKFLRLILLGLLVDHADYTIKDVFQRIAPFPKLHVLREGLKLFLHHFILKNKEKYPTGDVNIEQRVKIAEAALKAGETKLRM